MHSLIFNRPDSPKRMEHVKKQEFKDIDKLEFPISEGGADAPHLFPSTTVVVPAADEFYCQPCHLPPNLSRHLPHSSTCSYGIQALLHNVHRGYDGGDRTPDQIVSFTDERDEVSQQHESEILREWKRRKEEELQKRKRESQAKLDHILEQGALERKNFYKEREAQIEAKKKLNREREAKYHAEVEAKQQEQTQGGNLWAAVAALIDLQGDGDIGKTPTTTTGSTNTMKHVNSLSPKSMVEHQLSTPKKQDSGKSRPQNYLPKASKKSTDLSRMREILLKLRHQPLVR